MLQINFVPTEYVNFLWYQPIKTDCQNKMSERTYTVPTCDKLDLCRIYLLTETEDEFNSWLVVLHALEHMASCVDSTEDFQQCQQCDVDHDPRICICEERTQGA